MLKSLAAVFSILMLLVWLVDCAGGETKTFDGQVIDRVYVPEYTTWSTDSKGRYHSHYHPDDYSLVVRTWDGVHKIDTNMSGYYSVKPGQQIQYEARRGCITGVDWLASYYP